MKSRKSSAPFPVAVIAVIWLLASSAVGQSPQNPFDSLERTIQDEMRETKTPGAAVAVIREGRVAFAKGFGVTSIENLTPVTNETFFQIGSLTKLFTATAILKKADEQKLRLDVPIGTYVKDLNPRIAQLTLHQLLSQTSGLKDEPGESGLHEESALGTYARSWSADYLLFAPGKLFSYSNPGYSLAGLTLQEAGGTSYADQMKELLFQPLGMTRTTFRPTEAMTYPLAVGHRIADEGKPVAVRPLADDTRYWPAGYIFTNLAEYSRFVLALLNHGALEGKEVLPRAVVAQLFQGHAEMPSESSAGAKYGYGLVLKDYRGLHVAEHGGSMPGFVAELWMVPEHRWAILVLANRDGGQLLKSINKAMELMLPTGETAARTEPQALLLSPQEAAAAVGSYSNRWKMDLFLKQGQLYLRRFGAEMPVSKIGSNRYFVKPAGAAQGDEFLLLRGSDGKPEILQMFVWGFKREGSQQAEKPFSLSDASPLFEYDDKQALDLQSRRIRETGGITLYDVTYASPKGGRVTAYLLMPPGKGPFAGIVFGHWGYGTRTEFLPEAFSYAKTGAVSILVDYPWVRPAPWRRETTDLSQPELDVEIYAQAVIDLRRAVDVLLARVDVDPKRLAYVGHSYGAQWGAVLSAVEKRFRTVVLIGGTPSLSAIWLDSDDTGMVNLRNRVPKETLSRYIRVNSVLDGINYVPFAKPTPLLFQFARFERYFNEAAMRRYAEAASEPKQVLWYDTGHELNDMRALADRRAWLQPYIGLQPASPVVNKTLPRKK